jgi:hypothetical protein
MTRPRFELGASDPEAWATVTTRIMPFPALSGRAFSSLQRPSRLERQGYAYRQTL